MLERMSGIDVRTIPMNDPETMSIFSGVDALCIDTSKNTEETGAAGLPEYGTPFVRGILELTRPTTFDELLKISGLSHGTDVWLGNAKDLIDEGICTLKSVIVVVMTSWYICCIKIKTKICLYDYGKCA